MAYPFYYANPYNNFYPPAYQPQQTAQTPAGIIWVSGINEAQMYPVAPNNAVSLWENSGKVIYLKQADATGKPTMRIFDLVERTETSSAAPDAKDVKTPSYATKEELTAIVGAVNGLAGEVEQMKGDLYGVAGRKKAVKKETVDDDT